MYVATNSSAESPSSGSLFFHSKKPSISPLHFHLSCRCCEKMRIGCLQLHSLLLFDNTYPMIADRSRELSLRKEILPVIRYSSYFGLPDCASTLLRRGLDAMATELQVHWLSGTEARYSWQLPPTLPRDLFVGRFESFEHEKLRCPASRFENVGGLEALVVPECFAFCPDNKGSGCSKA